MDDQQQKLVLKARDFADGLSGPLFKFRAFDPAKDVNPAYQGYAASLLRDGLIYCASPFELNDPWEGRPAFAAPKEPLDHPTTRAFVQTLLEGRNEKDRALGLAMLEKFGLEEATNQMQDMLRNMHKGFGIYSMSTSPTHPLQWGYYAGGHRGYCWVLDNKVTPLSRAARVEYQEEHPEIEWPRWKHTNLVRLIFLIKALHWQHEGEFRILLPQAPAPQFFKVVAHNGTGEPGLGRYLRIPPEAVLGVIFGHGMTHPDAGKIVRLTREYGRRLNYQCAIIHRRKFEMATRELSAAEIDRLAKTP